MPDFLTNINIKATPSERSHAARLGDVYDIVGARMKAPVLAATTGNLGGAYASKVLTASANEALEVDGIAVAAGDRLLVAAQTDGTQNGIYVATAAGDASNPWVLTRADDFDETSKIFTGVKVHVIKGTSYADATFVLTTDSPVLDSTALEWSLDTGKLTLIKQHVGSIVGDNSTKDFPITHGFNTRAVTVDLHDAATYKTVYADVARTSDNAVTVTLDPAPQAGEDYVAIIRAEV